MDNGVFEFRSRIDKMVDNGMLTGDDEMPLNLLSQGRYIELKKYLDDARDAYLKAGR